MHDVPSNEANIPNSEWAGAAQILSKKLQRLQQKISRQEASAGGMKVELQVGNLPKDCPIQCTFWSIHYQSNWNQANSSFQKLSSLTIWEGEISLSYRPNCESWRGVSMSLDVVWKPWHPHMSFWRTGWTCAKRNMTLWKKQWALHVMYSRNFIIGSQAIRSQKETLGGRHIARCLVMPSFCRLKKQSTGNSTTSWIKRCACDRSSVGWANQSTLCSQIPIYSFACGYKL